MKTKILAIVAVLFMLSAPAMAQDFCNGDFDYDGAVTVEDTGEFLMHLGRNPYSVNPLKPPCPPDGPAPVAQTGPAWRPHRPAMFQDHCC
jgi:hypothetical protein